MDDQDTEQREPKRPRSDAQVLIPETVDPTQPFLRNFMAFEQDYFLLSQALYDPFPRNHAILRHCFGIHSRELNMTQVGASYNVTRERVRQIRERLLTDFRAMLSGAALPRPRRCCPREFVSQCVAFHNEAIAWRCIIRPERLFEYEAKPDPHIRSYLDLLMETLGFARTAIRGVELYYDAGMFNQQTLKDTISVVFHALNDELHPADPFAIVRKVGKERPDAGLTGDVIVNILEELPYIEYVTVHGKRGFQLRFDQLPNAGAMGVRVLRDERKTMYSRDIVREINNRLADSDAEKHVNAMALAAQFTKSVFVEAIGKTGLWALAQWGVNTDSLIELMIKALRACREPMSVDDLWMDVAKMRPNAKRESVRSMLRYSEDLVRLESGKIALREWNIDRKQLLTPSTASATTKKRPSRQTRE
ncbi:MAG: hypothetical protein KFF77_01375 [Bacteroidetes bacterium]|nr:hypothetical protein [Bacteroidota bacterium]